MQGAPTVRRRLALLRAGASFASCAFTPVMAKRKPLIHPPAKAQCETNAGSISSHGESKHSPMAWESKICPPLQVPSGSTQPEKKGY